MMVQTKPRFQIEKLEDRVVPAVFGSVFTFADPTHAAAGARVLVTSSHSTVALGAAASVGGGLSLATAGLIAIS